MFWLKKPIIQVKEVEKPLKKQNHKKKLAFPFNFLHNKRYPTAPNTILSDCHRFLSQIYNFLTDSTYTQLAPYHLQQKKMQKSQQQQLTDSSILSTDTPSKIDRTVYVYYNPKPTIKVCLKFAKDEISSLTLSELIGKVIKMLNEEYLLPINMVKSAYCVFPASKTGAKRDGYPELDSKLSLSKINMRRFYLEEVNKAFSLISTEFNLERKYGLEKKAFSDGSCCQIFKILKA